MPQNVFDKASRHAAKLDSQGFLSWLLGLAQDAFTFRAWLDTRTIPSPGDRDRTGDTVARLARPGGTHPPCAIAPEFQIQPDAEMFGRLLDYLSGLW